MAIKRINQIEPWVGEEEKAEIARTIDTGWVTEAAKTREFELMFAQYVGSRYACAVTSGTAALAVALLALDIGPGHEVIVPDFTFIPSANAVKMVGAEPILVDIDRENLCLNLEATAQAITGKTKAIMPVHFSGRCPNMIRLLEIARQRQLFVVEDACQVLGSRYMGKHLGTLGEIGCFSFSTPKIITTGQGGMLVTDNELLWEKFFRLKDFGRPRRGQYVHEILGYNFKFTDIQAAMGVAQMRKLEWRVNRKKEMFQLYRHLLGDTADVRFLDTNLEEVAPWFHDILLEDEKTRDGLAAFLDKRGIGTQRFYPPLHTLPPYIQVQGDFPNSKYVSERGLWLPSSSFLSDEDIERVCQEIRSYFGR